MGVAGVTSIAPQTFAKGRGANIKSVALKQGSNGNQKLVFELDKSVRHKLQTYVSPDRIVIDFLDTQSKQTLKLGRNSANNQQNLISKLRHSRRNHNDYRVVLDMTQKAQATSTLNSSGDGYFLEVALTPKKTAPTPTQQVRKALSAVSGGTIRKPMIVAIDAGHGGKDPGAIGRKGTKEKHVVLQIAQRLKKQIDRQPGMRAVLIRNGDYYVSLRKRIIKARSKKADLFVSIHADANPNSRLTGSSVYILSEKGASSEAAKWLANSENSYESKIAGANLHRGNKVVTSLLLDLSLSDTIDKSLDVASGVLKELGGVNDLLRTRVESAGFVVLKSPDIPSVLIETAFISNIREEKRLKTSRHQEKLAKAIFKGIRRYQIARVDQQPRESDIQYS
jgi:N-acetylmuramoyl-L-alanine amidase